MRFPFPLFPTSGRDVPGDECARTAGASRARPAGERAGGLVTRARRCLRGAATALGALLLSGCHTYLPVQTPTPGTTARVHVPVRSALADPNAPPRTAFVEGTVLSVGDTIVLEVRTRRYYGALQELVQENVYRVDRDEIIAVELREVSMGRSVALGVAILGGIGVLALAALGERFGMGGRKPSDNGGQSFTAGFRRR